MKIKSIIIALAILFIPKIALAERIVDFDSQMVINQDRSIDVTETITYDSEGVESQGIFRTIALDRKFVGNIQVFRDGIPEPVLITRDWLNNNINIRIGEEGVYFRGIRKYILKYKYNNILKSDNNVDILQHSITGNKWQIPINKSSATIILLQSLNPNDIIQIQCEIINSKNTSSDQCQSTQISDKIIQFSYNKTILQSNGLEINLQIKSGILDKAPLYSRIDLDRNIAILILSIGLISLTIIWVIWYKNKSIKYESVVQYTPPKNLSPAGVGYLRRQAPHPRLISALMISLARQGILKIKQNFDKKFWQKSKYSFDMIDKEKAQEVKYMGEAFLIESLFKYYLMTNNRLFLEIRALISKKERKKETMNFIIPLLLCISIAYTLRIDIIIAVIILIIYYSYSFNKVNQFNEIYQAIYLEEVAHYYTRIPILIKSLLNLIILIGPILTVISYISGYSIIAIATIIIVIVAVILNRLNPKRTPEGDKIMAYILGLEEYIVVAEKHRLDFQSKNYLFFEILPYAIALGHERVWSKAFEGIVIDQPDWYEGKVKYDHTFSTYWFYNDIIYSVGQTMTSITSRSYDSHDSGGGFWGSGFGGGGGFGRGGGGGSW